MEKTLWRTATLISIILPPVALFTIPLSHILVQWGDSREFMRSLLRAVREYTWHAGPSEKRRARHVRDDLEMVYNDPSNEQKLSENVLGGGEEDEDQAVSFRGNPTNLSRERVHLKAWDHSNSRKTSGISLGRSWRRLMWWAGRRSSPTGANTNDFPLQPWLPESVNHAIIYATSIIYCLARLSIIVLAFTCLRSMPDSVYLTTWATSVPSVE